ncbi:MAG: hypothetical protein PHN32_07415 [Actinomycetota bacterium]|nr:hypothetical protein [Actinomycetota bacterium]
MKNRTMIIIITAALVLIAAGVFLTVRGFSPNTEAGVAGDGFPVEGKSSNLTVAEEEGQIDLEQDEGQQQEEQTGIDEENLEAEKKELEETSIGEQPPAEDLGLKQYYSQMTGSGQPSIIVFSYDAECCESTRIFFENYNRQAQGIMESYQDSFNTLFINTGTLSSEDMQTALEIAKDTGALSLPSLVVLDSQGQAYKVFEGTFQAEEVEALLEELKNA